MQVENVCEKGIVGCFMLQFEPGALVWWSIGNKKVSVAQFKIRKSTDIYQSQGLIILANIFQPKGTISAFVIFKVFNGLILRVRVDIQ